jgi:hypothetical protein
MKDAKFTLEFTSHVLANGIGPKGEPDHFQRDGQNQLVFQQSWFHSAFTRAIDIARIRGVKASDIQVDLTFTAPTQIYKRRYGDSKYRTHEAIMPGTRVVFCALVADQVTDQVLRMLLERMGKFIGLSPYGYRLGYGKFSVADVTVAPSDAAMQ